MMPQRATAGQASEGSLKRQKAMGRVTKGERSGAARLIPRARASRTSQNVKSWKVARVGPVLPERAASEGRRRGSSQTVLLARRAPTMRRWSLDARSEGQPGYSLFGEEGDKKPARSGGPRPDRLDMTHTRAGRARKLKGSVR